MPTFRWDIVLQTNFGRDIAFSADLCYNGTNEKSRPLGEVAAKPTERAQLCAKNPLTRYRGSSPKGRAFGGARSSLGVWALPDAFVIQRHRAIRRRQKMFFTKKKKIQKYREQKAESDKNAFDFLLCNY